MPWQASRRTTRSPASRRPRDWTRSTSACPPAGTPRSREEGAEGGPRPRSRRTSAAIRPGPEAPGRLSEPTHTHAPSHPLPPPSLPRRRERLSTSPPPPSAADAFVSSGPFGTLVASAGAAADLPLAVVPAATLLSIRRPVSLAEAVRPRCWKLFKSAPALPRSDAHVRRRCRHVGAEELLGVSCFWLVLFLRGEATISERRVHANNRDETSPVFVGTSGVKKKAKYSQILVADGGWHPLLFPFVGLVFDLPSQFFVFLHGLPFLSHCLPSSSPQLPALGGARVRHRVATTVETRL